MAIVTISHEMGSVGSKIGMSVAERLKYRYVDQDLIDQAAQRYGCLAEKLARLDETQPSRTERFKAETRYYITALQSAVLDAAEADDAVIMGRGGQMLLQRIAHALRLFVGAPVDLRVKRVMEDLGGPVGETVDLRTTAEMVRRCDQQKMGSIWYLFAVDWKEPTLYDLVINTEALSVEAAVELILSVLRRPELAPTEASRQAVRDRALASRVRCALAAHRETRRYRISVEADHGIIRLEGAEPLEKAAEVARSVAGVVEVKPQLLETVIIPPFPR